MKKGPYHKVLSLSNGIVRVRKHCGFCDRSHVVNFPLDDLGMESRMSTFCDRCEREAEKIKRKQKELD